MTNAHSVIGEEPEGHYALDLDRHADQLPAEAGPLVRVLRTEGVKAARTLFGDADAEACSIQAEYRRYGVRFIVLTAIAAIAAAIVLYLPAAPNSHETLPVPREVADLLRYVFVGVSVLAGALAIHYKTRLGSQKLFDDWMLQRANAEHHRNQYFERIFATPDPDAGRGGSAVEELDLASLRFEYFRRYQFDLQINYFTTRGRLHEKAAKKLIGLEGILAAIGAGVAAILAVKELLGDFATVIALIGVVVPTLVSARSSFSMLSQDQLHGARYRANRELLISKGPELDVARAALEAHREDEARAFVGSVNGILEREIEIWRSAFLDS